MAAMVSSNMTDSGSSASRCRRPSPAADTCPAPVIRITVAEEAPLLPPARPAQALHAQASPCALEQPPQSGQLHEEPWNAAGAAGAQSPQPHPCT